MNARPTLRSPRTGTLPPATPIGWEAEAPTGRLPLVLPDPRPSAPAPARPAPARPAADQPSVAPPTVAQPTVAQPTVAQPSVIQPSVIPQAAAQQAVAHPTTAHPTTAHPAEALPGNTVPTDALPVVAPDDRSAAPAQPGAVIGRLLVGAAAGLLALLVMLALLGGLLEVTGAVPA